MRGASIGAAVAAMLFAGGAAAEEKITVQSLLGQDFQIVGSIFNPASGASVFLQKKDRLFFCALIETANSPDLATRYCKPVH